jgi:hypothetical protein
LEKPGFACDPDGFLNAGQDGTKGKWGKINFKK